MAKNSMPLVSVVIPTYGRATALRAAIESVLLQNYPEIEIVVVDDNGINTAFQQETEKAVSDLIDQHAIKYVVREANGGGSAARNLGIERAAGDLIGFLDDDDLFYRTKISHQVKHLNTHNLDVSVCDMEFVVNGSSIETPGRYARVENLSQFLVDGNVYTPMILGTKRAFLDVGGFSVTPRYQDHIFMLKLLGAGFRVGSLRETLFVHKEHNGQRISSLKNAEKGLACRLEAEEQYVHLLSREALSQVRLRNTVMSSKLEKVNGSTSTAVYSLVAGSKYVRNVSGFKIWVKAILRILFTRISSI